MKEFASALNSFVPVAAWSPAMSWTGLLQNHVQEEAIADPPLTIHRFPLQRGYHRFPISSLTRLGARQSARMRSHKGSGPQSPLICTTPYYAPVAEHWKGPVVYYQTDLTFAYEGLNSDAVRELDTRLCRVADAVCPNSRRVGDYMVHEARCDPSKIDVVPNATRESNIAGEPLLAPAVLPADISDMPRPIIGIIGNLAGNLDWALLRQAIEQTPSYSWVFVGPTTMEIEDPAERQARAALIERGLSLTPSRIKFVGAKPYRDLQAYARCFDVAVLPYQCKEPTYSGSSTRYYEHLAAGRPMLSTRGFEELIHLRPLVDLFDNAQQLISQLRALERENFRDGFEIQRWQASRQGTWQMRAQMVIRALQTRWMGAPIETGHLAPPSDLPLRARFQDVMSPGFELMSSRRIVP